MIGELAVRSVLSAIVIAGVTVVARRDPVLGGWISVFPTTTSLALIWLAFDGTPVVRMADFTGGVIAGLLPTTAVLIALAALLRQGVALPLSGLAALAIWLVMTFVVRQLGLFQT